MRNFISTVTFLAATALAGCATAPREAASAGTASEASSVAPRIIEGDLDISNETSLEQYANLEIVTGTLTIVGNTRLENLDGLSNLRAVGHLVITENVALSNIEGLFGLRHARSVTISKNPRLEQLHGLDMVKKLDRLIVTENGIFSTSGIGGLTEVGELVISKNRRLISLRGFTRLESAGSVTIVDNPRLAAQSGFLAHLRRVSGKLEVKRNAGIHASEVDAFVQRVKPVVQVASR
jgi:hypothetical protein